MIYIKGQFDLNLTSANAFGEVMTPKLWKERRYFIGGSDARLWREKRGEVEPEDLSGNLVVQLE